MANFRQYDSRCKICNAFDEKIIEEITLDILLHRRTYVQIKEYYTQFLPANIAKLNDVNIANHKRHSDPCLVAEKQMVLNGTPKSEADILTNLYSKRFQNTIDRKTLLSDIHKARLQNLYALQLILEARQKELPRITQLLQAFLDRDQSYLTDAEKLSQNLLLDNKKYLENEVRSLIKQIDGIHAQIQEVLIKEVNSEKGLAEGTIHITQNYINIFQGHLKGFIDEMVPLLLLKVFKDDPTKGQYVVQELSGLLDKHITPALQDSQFTELPS